MTRKALLRLLRLARIGCDEIFEAQLKAAAADEADRRKTGHRDA